MRKFLIPLLASIALPTAVNAESYWLTYRKNMVESGVMDKIEMESMEQCEEQGKRWEKENSLASYFCIIGK